MDPSATITAPIFAAYLKCPTKAYLIAHGEQSPETFFTDMRGRISAAYKTKAFRSAQMGPTGVVPFDFLQAGGDPVSDVAPLFVDCETAWYVCNHPASARLGQRVKKSEAGDHYIPTLYSAWDKVDESDELLVCLCALAIEQATGTNIALSGKVVYGEEYRGKTIKIADRLPKARRIIEAVTSVCYAEKPPPLVLNKHCPTCDFQLRCRTLASERENMSLLGAMTTKERAKYEEKGISTITQLSYGYRPRRRRLMPAAPRSSPPVKHDHSLKALAIKKAQTHVVGSPSLSIKGTSVFMDVEGMPDRDFYYLVSLRYATNGTPVEKSFWADGAEGERDIWRQCLCTLKSINNPQIVHYGAYESRFLKRMRERWKSPAEDAEFVDQIIDGSLNLLTSMYGTVYFPTYSNSLKEISRWLGFDWTWSQASGAASTLLRRCWELTGDDDLRRELIAYNLEDCRATVVVTEALSLTCGNGEACSTTKLDTVNVGSLEIGFQRTFGKFPSTLPEFKKINAAAYWDYQRSIVYVRTNKQIRKNRCPAWIGSTSYQDIVLLYAICFLWM